MTLMWKDRPDGVRLLRLEGALDDAGTARLEPQFAGSTLAARLNVIVDLAAVSVAGSAALRLLADTARAMRQNGNRLVLANPQPPVRQALEQAGLPDFPPVAADLAAAEGLLA